MGYTTDFEGALEIKPSLTQEKIDYLQKFNGTRRMKRTFENNQHGVDGEFYVDGKGFAGQDKDESIIDYNAPPSTQPSLWCQWTVSGDGSLLEWDEGEKFYCYIEWLEYMIKNFFANDGYVLSGSIKWQGEEMSDRGLITVENNVVQSQQLV